LSFGTVGLAVGVQQLGAVLDDAAVLLRHAGRKPGTSSNVTSGTLNAVAEPNEARALERRSDVQHARQVGGLDWRRSPPPGRQPGKPVSRSRRSPAAPRRTSRRPLRGGSRRACRTACSARRARTSSSSSSRRSGGSSDGRTGGLSRLFEGRNDSSVRTAVSDSSSESWTKWATPDVPPWTSAPPRRSKSTSSCVTVFTTLGPVTKHVGDAAHHEDEVGDGGTVDRAPAHGPRMALIWGTTPEASVLRRRCRRTRRATRRPPGCGRRPNRSGRSPERRSSPPGPSPCRSFPRALPTATRRTR